MQGLQARGVLEQLHGQVRGGRVAGRRIAGRLGLLAGALEQCPDRLDAGGGAGDQHQREIAQPGDRREVAPGVVGQVLVQAGVDRRHALVDQDQRVAVRRGLRGRLHADDAARAGFVLDDDRLAQLVRQAAGHQARQRVGQPAHRDGGDQPHRPFRIGGGAGRRGAQRQARQQGPQCILAVHDCVSSLCPGRAALRRACPGGCPWSWQ
ncbi:Uncharacterised protein [Bordetella pertussis]|nr:Uncharacterised protein [Bordetella pertussis]CFM32395.1 Uncharacterised protein [Bordetella pertussis]CFM90627.1 Uncharacterised protein [Bordetella pertussis]CFN10439.1 Uncharacterised protein [Bordetella pertussis]CFN51919.1 Uncharacterised protein [Bordetella pertussis]